MNTYPVEHVFRNETLAIRFVRAVKSAKFTKQCNTVKPDSVDECGRASVFVDVKSRRQADFIYGLACGIDAE